MAGTSMGAYEVNGTEFLTIGSGRRWNVYRKPVVAGSQREAGPFESRSAAIKWANHEHDALIWQRAARDLGGGIQK